jgi:hypothetical protein
MHIVVLYTFAWLIISFHDLQQDEKKQINLQYANNQQSLNKKGHKIACHLHCFAQFITKKCMM